MCLHYKSTLSLLQHTSLPHSWHVLSGSLSSHPAINLYFPHEIALIQPKPLLFLDAGFLYHVSCIR